MPEHLDHEAPELLSDRQLEAKSRAIVDALADMGLKAKIAERYPGDYHRLRVEEPTTCHLATVELDAEGGATWEVWGETPGEQHVGAEVIIRAVRDRLLPQGTAPGGPALAL